MAKIDNLCGRRFGKLTVAELMPEREERYARYRCLCDCGNEISVNSKRLKRGIIQGCADCWKPRGRERPELSGKRSGQLTVLRLAERRRNNRKTWECGCDCGGYREASTYELQSGCVTHCGCMNRRSYPYRELAGMQKGMLTVLEKTAERSEKGSVLWRCRCECGNEKLFSEDALVHGRTVSCGCYREKELPKKLNIKLHHLDGTCVEFLQRKKRSDNTSGHTGVYITPNGRYKAGITFKKKRYHLGVYDTLEDAICARKRGEEMHSEFLDWYYKTYPGMVDKRKQSV